MAAQQNMAYLLQGTYIAFMVMPNTEEKQQHNKILSFLQGNYIVITITQDL